jgi:hypothetical protein
MALLLFIYINVNRHIYNEDLNKNKKMLALEKECLHSYAVNVAVVVIFIIDIITAL